MANCTVCVGSAKPRYDKINCGKPFTRKYGSDRFVAIKCGTNFTNILDPTEWATKIADGSVILSPGFGTLKLGKATAQTIPLGCGGSIRDIATTPWTFTTPSATSDKTDEDFWYHLDLNAKYYTFIPLECDDSMHLPDELMIPIRLSQGTPGNVGSAAAVPASSPGYEFNITEMPDFGEGPGGQGKSGLWSIAGSFEHSTVKRTVKIPGISAVIANG